MTDSFPRQHARTRRFTLGQPRGMTVGADGARVVFLRSPAGDDPQTALWVYDVGGAERLVADPRALLHVGGEELSVQERARRERSRETAAGIVDFATDRDARVAAFALSSRVFVANLVDGRVRQVAGPGPLVDPRPDPTGRRVAYVADRRLHVAGVDGTAPQAVTPEEAQDVTWGLADFIAAEEMHRYRGYWWAPDGERLLVARVDESPVTTWWIADPARPDVEPRAVRYPPPGSDNAVVTLHVVGLDGSVRDVAWDMGEFPYLARVAWPAQGDPLIAVQARDQRTVRLLAVHPGTGATSLLREDTDPAWVDLAVGVPARLDDGRVVWVADDRDSDTTRLVVGDEFVSDVGLQVRSVLGVAGDAVLYAASPAPTQVQVRRWSAGDDTVPVAVEPGVHSATGAGDVVAVTSASLESLPRTHVCRDGRTVHTLESYAETPCVAPRVRMLSLGPSALRAGLLLPRDHAPGRRLRVLLDPYGGPGAQRVLATRSAWLTSQWLADQGFAVLVVDGRGSPGRGPRWERQIAGDLATPVLADQVDALHAAAEIEPDLDLTRVGVRGWSFGGYLAALAVLRRPDVFHAAVAGAPVTDWRLYDTHYTERYLGTDPDRADRAAYDASSLLADAPALTRPLMLIHGVADDNVVVAHTLALSQRLTENGRPHTVLPLSGVTHMPPQEAVAENRLLLQVAFLDRALGPR